MIVFSLDYFYNLFFDVKFKKGLQFINDKGFLSFEVHLRELENINISLVWNGVFLLKVWSGFLPKVSVKSYKKTYFKTLFNIYIFLLIKDYLTVCFVLNLNKLLLFINYFDKCIIKRNYLKILINQMSFVRYFEIKPEFLSWNEYIYILFFLTKNLKNLLFFRKYLLNFFNFNKYYINLLGFC